MSSTLSKLVMTWGVPSSVTVTSPWARSVTGLPFLSITTTSTITCSTWAGKVGVASWGGDGVLGLLGLAGSLRGVLGHGRRGQGKAEENDGAQSPGHG